MISRNVIEKLKRYCTEVSTPDQTYGYVAAMQDFGFMSESEATRFLDLYVWFEDSEAAWNYLEGCAF